METVGQTHSFEAYPFRSSRHSQRRSQSSSIALLYRKCRRKDDHAPATVRLSTLPKGQSARAVTVRRVSLFRGNHHLKEITIRGEYRSEEMASPGNGQSRKPSSRRYNHSENLFCVGSLLEVYRFKYVDTSNPIRRLQLTLLCC